MDRHHHRQLIVSPVQGELPLSPPPEFIVPAEDNTIDVLEESDDIDVEPA